MISRTNCVLFLLASGLLFSGPADAYIGPGAGVTVIGTVLALIGVVLFGIIGFIWYPIKRLRARLAKSSASEDEKAERSDAKDDGA